MTTAAYDGRYLAADRLMTSAGGLRRTVDKIRDCGGYLYAPSGSIVIVALVTEWLKAGAKASDRPKLEEGGCHGFVVERATGHLMVVEGNTPALERIYDRFHATGSGMDYALSAMALGQSAAEAVLFASRFDVFTGSDVDVIDVANWRTTFQAEPPK